MLKIITLFILSILINHSLSWSQTIEQQQEELRSILELRFKNENLKAIRDAYEKELFILEAQYDRNKQIEDFQKRQQADTITTAVYTSKFNYVTPDQWQKNLTKYADDITVTKINRQNTTELIFHFPTKNSHTKKQFETYRLPTPTIKVVSVLLASRKLVEINQVISPKINEQTVSVKTDNASILKINLEMTYQIPAEETFMTILTPNQANQNGLTLLPAFDNVALLQLSKDKADSIIHIEAIDMRGNALATHSPEKLININNLSTQAMRIDMLKSFLASLDNQTIKNQHEAIDFLLKNSESYLLSANNTQRQLSKSFTGKIEQVIVYAVDNLQTLNYKFSIY